MSSNASAVPAQDVQMTDAVPHDEEPIDHEYIEFRSYHSDKIKAMFESADVFVQEVKLRFTENGLYFISNDNIGIVLIALYLPSSFIRETGGKYIYNTKMPCVDIGLNLKYLADLLKRTGQDDTIGFHVDVMDDENITIIEANAKTKKYSEHKLRQITVADTVDYEELNKVTYETSILMDSTMFNDNIKKLNIIKSETVRLWCDGERLIMMSKGAFAETKIQIVCKKSDPTPQSSTQYEVEPNQIPQVSTGTTADESSSQNQMGMMGNATSDLSDVNQNLQMGQTIKWPMDQEYPKEYLTKIAKAKSVSRKIALLLSKRCPALTLVYDTFIGSIRYILAPFHSTLGDIKLSLPPLNAHEIYSLPHQQNMKRSNIMPRPSVQAKSHMEVIESSVAAVKQPAAPRKERVPVSKTKNPKTPRVKSSEKQGSAGSKPPRKRAKNSPVDEIVDHKKDEKTQERCKDGHKKDEKADAYKTPYESSATTFNKDIAAMYPSFTQADLIPNDESVSALNAVTMSLTEQNPFHDPTPPASVPCTPSESHKVTNASKDDDSSSSTQKSQQQKSAVVSTQSSKMMTVSSSPLHKLSSEGNTRDPLSALTAMFSSKDVGMQPINMIMPQTHTFMYSGPPVAPSNKQQQRATQDAKATAPKKKRHYKRLENPAWQNSRTLVYSIFNSDMAANLSAIMQDSSNSAFGVQTTVMGEPPNVPLGNMGPNGTHENRDADMQSADESAGAARIYTNINHSFTDSMPARPIDEISPDNRKKRRRANKKKISPAKVVEPRNTQTGHQQQVQQQTSSHDMSSSSSSSSSVSETMDSSKDKTHVSADVYNEDMMPPPQLKIISSLSEQKNMHYS